MDGLKKRGRVWILPSSSDSSFSLLLSPLLTLLGGFLDVAVFGKEMKRKARRGNAGFVECKRGNKINLISMEKWLGECIRSFFVLQKKKKKKKSKKKGKKKEKRKKFKVFFFFFFFSSLAHLSSQQKRRKKKKKRAEKKNQKREKEKEREELSSSKPTSQNPQPSEIPSFPFFFSLSFQKKGKERRKKKSGRKEGRSLVVGESWLLKKRGRGNRGQSDPSDCT
jgi:hypothetical protein